MPSDTCYKMPSPFHANEPLCGTSTSSQKHKEISKKQSNSTFKNENIKALTNLKESLNTVHVIRFDFLDVSLDFSRSDLVLLRQVREFGQYPDGWLGFDVSVAPTKATIRDAETFIRSFDTQNMKSPYISLAADGEINFWWDLPEIKLDLGVFGEGTYAFYAKLKDGTEFSEDGCLIGQSLPDCINHVLRKL